MSTIKNAIIGLLLLVLVITLPITVYFGKSYFALNSKIASMENNNFLAGYQVDSNNKTAQGFASNDDTSIKNRYILNNDKGTTPINLKLICEQKNGILCVTKENEKLKFIGSN